MLKNIDKLKETMVNENDVENVIKHFAKAQEINQDGDILKEIQVIQMETMNDLFAIRYYDADNHRDCNLIMSLDMTAYNDPALNHKLNDALDRTAQCLALKKCGYNKRLNYIEQLEEGIRSEMRSKPWITVYEPDYYSQVYNKISDYISSDANYYDSYCNTRYKLSETQIDSWFKTLAVPQMIKLLHQITNESDQYYDEWHQEDEDENVQDIPAGAVRMMNSIDMYCGIINEAINRRLLQMLERTDKEIEAYENGYTKHYKELLRKETMIIEHLTYGECSRIQDVLDSWRAMEQTRKMYEEEESYKQEWYWTILQYCGVTSENTVLA